MTPPKASRSIATLEDLTKAYQNYVATIVTNRLHHHVPERLGVDYEDVMQEVWLKMLHMFDQYDRSRASIKTFLTLTCLFVIRTHNNRLRTIEGKSLFCGDDYLTDNHVGDSTVDCADLLEKINLRLSPLAREVLAMRMKGFSPRDIESALNRGRGHIWSAITEMRRVAEPILQESGLM